MLLYETINLQQCFPIESPRSYLDLLSTVHAKSQVYEGAHELLCLYVFDKDLIGWASESLISKMSFPQLKSI